MLENFDNVFDDILLTFEEILWKGQPRRNILTSWDLLYLCFCLMWFAIGIFIAYEGYYEFNSVYAIVIGAVVGFISIAMIFGRVKMKDNKDKNTYYLITNQRIIILMQMRYKRLLELELDKITVSKKSVRKSGVGTLYLDAGIDNLLDAYHDYNPDGTERRSKSIFTSTVFKNIPEVDKVYLILDRAIREYKREEAEFDF